MAVRTPLKLSGDQLKEMTSSEITAIRNRAVQLFLANPSVGLTVTGSGGNLGTYYDTRLVAGAAKTSTTAYPSAADTPNVYAVSVAYSRINQFVSSVSAPVDTTNSRFPLYYDGSNLRSMTLQDMYDTFIFSAMTTLRDSRSCLIANTSSITGYTLVSSTPVMYDTGANTSLYTAAGITEAQDQPYTRQTFYLHRRNSSLPSITTPVRNEATSQTVRQYTSGDFDGILSELIRYVAANVANYRLRYSIGGAGTDCGSMWDDRLNGSGNYQTRFVNADDYRAQEFPNGSFVRINTYFLRSRLA